MPLLKKLNVKLNLNKHEKILVCGFVLLVALFFYYQYVFEAQAKKISVLKKDIKSKHSMVNQLIGQGYGDVSQLSARIGEIDAEMAKLYEKAPNVRNLPGLLVDFYKSAKNNNVVAQTITFGKLEAKENYSSFPVSLDVLGTKANVFNFIKEIEGYPRLSRISRIEFEPQAGNTILAKISDEFYVLNEVQADPLDYPFMEDKLSLNSMFELFKEYKVSSEVDKNGNIIVKGGVNNQRTGGIGSGLGVGAAGKLGGYNSGGNNGYSNLTPGTAGNKGAEKGTATGDNPYPWLAPVK